MVECTVTSGEGKSPFLLLTAMKGITCACTQRKCRNTERQEVCCVSNKAAFPGAHMYRDTVPWCDLPLVQPRYFCVTPLGGGFSGAAGSELHLAFRVLLHVPSDQEGTTSARRQQSTEVEAGVLRFEVKVSLLPPVQAGGDILVPGQMLSNDTETKSCCMFRSAEERQVWITDFQEPF